MIFNSFIWLLVILIFRTLLWVKLFVVDALVSFIDIVWLEPFLTQNVSGSYVFIPEIKDMIMFEYHDCTNTNSLPNADLILCRDLLSFLPADVQNNVLLDFEDRLKGNGIMILGENESLAGKMQWYENLIENISIYTK